jgi:P-type conjugative transfer protein TrbJ
MKNTSKYLLMAALSGGMIMPFQTARASAVVGATEITQILNNVELVLGYVEQVEQTIQQAQQLRNQIDSYKTQLQNMKNLGSWNWTQYKGLLKDLASNIRAGQKYAYVYDKMTDKLKDEYPGYGQDASKGMNMKPEELEKTYQKWSDKNLESIATALSFVEVSLEDIQNDKVDLDKLAAQVQAADGEVQAIAATAQIAAAQVTQLQKLRETMLMQTKMLAEFRSQQVSKEEAAQAARENTLADETPHTRTEGKTYRPQDFKIQ